MRDDGLIADNMVVQPALQARLAGMIADAGLPESPGVPYHFIGLAALTGGTSRRLFVRHAADAVLTDAGGHIVLITRLNRPGAGRLAIPGGFLDLVGGVCEDVVAAARRELIEETGIAAEIAGGARVLGVGWRRYNRQFDLRVAWSDIVDTAIRQGDIFMVSTQPVFLRTNLDLTSVALRAGDDAGAALVMNIADIEDETLGIPDQREMIAEMP